MLKYLYLLIITLSIGGAVASYNSLEITEESEPLSLHNMQCDEVVGYIASYLDPLSLSRLLRANQELGKAIRAKNQYSRITPIPSGKGLLDEIILKHAIMGSESIEFESYVFEICQRLPYTFNRILGAQMTWQDFPKELGNHRDAFISWCTNSTSLVEFNTAADLKSLYCKILTGSYLEDDAQAFLEDTPERRQAISYMRPWFLLGYITAVLGSNINDDQYSMGLVTSRSMLQVFQCYETSVRQKYISIQPQVNFKMLELYLRQAMWQANIYHDALRFDHSTQGTQALTFPVKLGSCLVTHEEFWLRTKYDPLTEVPLYHFARTTRSWLTEMVGMMSPTHFSETLTKESVNVEINAQVNQLFYRVASSYPENIPTDDRISSYQRRAVYFAEAAALAEKDEHKAVAYYNAGVAKLKEAQLLSAEIEREKKAQTFAQSASYTANAGVLYTDNDKKVMAYNSAALAKFQEAELLNAEIDCEKKARALAQSVSYTAEAVALFTDNVQKAPGHMRIGYIHAKLGEQKEASDYFQKCIDFLGNEMMAWPFPDTLEMMEEALKTTNADVRYLEWVENQRYDDKTPD